MHWARLVSPICWGLNQAQQALVFRFNHEHGFTAADGVMLDLQWGLAQRNVSRRVDMAGIWRRVTMARLLDFDAPTFCAEDLAVCACSPCGKRQPCVVAVIAVLRYGPGAEETSAAGLGCCARAILATHT